MSPSHKHLRSGYTVVSSLVLAALMTLLTSQAFAQKNLFNSEPNSPPSAPVEEMISPPDDAEENEPAITATEAALRAQRHADGKVMNVRQFQDENKTFYGVKVLQKNGRMKTINVDANNGNIVE